jgi:UDP-glucose 4-epimerase
MAKALNGEPPIIYGDGSQTRDFVFVGDVVQALIAAVNSSSAPGKVFNVGSGKSVTVNGLWGTIADLSGAESKPVYVPPRVGDVPHSLATIEAAQTHLQFVPQVSFEKGLELTMEWYRTSLTFKK